jgi:hypothetical protein
MQVVDAVDDGSDGREVSSSGAVCAQFLIPTLVITAESYSRAQSIEADGYYVTAN